MAVPNGPAGFWYLGIDLGTTHLSAALFDRLTCQLYPLYWHPLGSQGSDPTFRLPSQVYLRSQGWWLHQFKPLLLPGIAGTKVKENPWDSGMHPTVVPLELLNRKRAKREMVLRSHGRSLGLSDLLDALSALLATIAAAGVAPLAQGEGLPVVEVASGSGRSLRLPSASSPRSHAVATLSSALTMATPSAAIGGAAGLDPDRFPQAIAQLRGAIVSFPGSWPDSYCFNIRESILSAKLVQEPSQVLFVENAIAAWLSVLPGVGGERVTIPSVLSRQFHPQEGPGASWHRSRAVGTRYGLAIDSGATMTELALVSVPENLEELSDSHFKTRSFPYAGQGLDQDIICQLFWTEAVRRENRGYWYLGCDLELPRPGEPDGVRRMQLQQRLLEHPAGRELLAAAEEVKLALQERDVYPVTVGEFRWTIAHRELQTLVVEPFLNFLNQALNGLLIETGLSAIAIERAVCTGGTAQSPSLKGWMRQKLPNAMLIADPPRGNRGSGSSRIAFGLAALPLYPRVLDLNRQQYGDYFLLAELLRAITDDCPRSLGEIVALVEHRGIHGRSLGSRIQGFLDGDLPPGLSSTGNSAVPMPEVAATTEYPLTRDIPLFEQVDGTYRVNLEQSGRLLQYLQAIATTTHQHFEDPLLLYLSEFLTPPRHHSENFSI
ncbi:hypothetical protein [Oscillatoria acuminata]|uniref:Uncharacterized protein n=1 Tax=Oscillatoria acuminata PCC 6304 TaxID=56110 RepID=K9TGN7_9CYAN|nr:hypothetical protein [Oscillatoria acuminata]AFY81189.1 hypothetical protein Oscil6304_1484 [Oscillatoria acuminata PCC 6304]